jgi:hypothetical protein
VSTADQSHGASLAILQGEGIIPEMDALAGWMFDGINGCSYTRHSHMTQLRSMVWLDKKEANNKKIRDDRLDKVVTGDARL